MVIVIIGIASIVLGAMTWVVGMSILEGLTLEVTCRHCGATACFHGNPISVCRQAQEWFNQHRAEFGEPPLRFTHFMMRWFHRC